MHVFYSPDVLKTNELSPEEAAHCMRVLRLREKDEILITDGQGHYFKAFISGMHKDQCRVDIFETINYELPWSYRVEIAIAPTKNLDRVEWFVEKATEIGISRISFLNCRFSERKELKIQRIQKIAISAMKQSLKAVLPEIREINAFDKFITAPFDGKKWIAHCYPEEKKILSQSCKKNENVLILIGPEGDFSREEVDNAIQCGFEPISLGPSRLRTETAALMACHTVHVVNQVLM